MAKWICTVCGYIYDEEEAGTAFEDLPDDWVCPVCGAGKEAFKKEEDQNGRDKARNLLGRRYEVGKKLGEVIKKWQKQ